MGNLFFSLSEKVQGNSGVSIFSNCIECSGVKASIGGFSLFLPPFGRVGRFFRLESPVESLLVVVILSDLSAAAFGSVASDSALMVVLRPLATAAGHTLRAFKSM